MKPISLEAFLLLYKITRSKKFSYYTSIVVVSVLHIIVLGGLSELLQGVFPTSIITKLFSFPFYFGTFFIVAFLNTRIFPFKATKKVDHLEAGLLRLLLYVLLCVLIWAYKTYGGKLN